MNYKYFMPTKVFIGKNCILNQKENFKVLGKKALIVTGTHSAKVNGSEADVRNALESLDIRYKIYDKVMSNPTISCVYEGAKVAKENHVDFIISIGGGSPIDAAKGIALLAFQDIPEEELFLGNYENKVLPLVAIPTTAGTGSEVTQYSILTNDEAQTKTSIASDLIFPIMAFLDAKYMENLSVETTINTGIDALSHAIEGMLSARASFISDALAVKSISMIMGCLPKMLRARRTNSLEIFDEATRDTLLHASFLAGIVIAQTGTTVVHAMGYSLTYFKDVDHGKANGFLLGEYLKLVETENPLLAKKVLNAIQLNNANDFIGLMKELLTVYFDINEDEIKQYSELAIQTKNIENSKVKPSEKDIVKMYVETFNINKRR